MTTLRATRPSRPRIARPGLGTRSGLVLAAILGLSSLPAANAQDGSPSLMYGGEGPAANRLLGGINKPNIPPQGAWGEVIMANGRWVVLQNADGQQFPISYDSVQQFVVRWPTRLEIVAADAFFEVTGVDLGSNQIRTDHVDVYEANARSMVTPTMLRLFGANRVLNPLDVEQQQIYGAIFPFSPEEQGIPPRVHIVGTAIGVDPLRVAAPGNNWVAVHPAETGFSMTQVTVGSPTYTKKGDVAYYIPIDAGPKSLTVGRLILYKDMPFRAFVTD